MAVGVCRIYVHETFLLRRRLPRVLRLARLISLTAWFGAGAWSMTRQSLISCGSRISVA